MVNKINTYKHFLLITAMLFSSFASFAYEPIDKDHTVRPAATEAHPEEGHEKAGGFDAGAGLSVLMAVVDGTYFERGVHGGPDALGTPRFDFSTMLAQDSALLTEAEQGELHALMQKVESAATGSGANAVEAAVEALATGTEAFAAARMNQGIRQALAGRRIEDV